MKRLSGTKSPVWQCCSDPSFTRPLFSSSFFLVANRCFIHLLLVLVSAYVVSSVLFRDRDILLVPALCRMRLRAIWLPNAMNSLEKSNSLLLFVLIFLSLSFFPIGLCLDTCQCNILLYPPCRASLQVSYLRRKKIPNTANLIALVMNYIASVKHSTVSYIVLS